MRRSLRYSGIGGRTASFGGAWPGVILVLTGVARRRDVIRIVMYRQIQSANNLRDGVLVCSRKKQIGSTRTLKAGESLTSFSRSALPALSGLEVRVYNPCMQGYEIDVS